MTRQDVVNRILEGRRRVPSAQAQAFAPANIALCKYWGKRDRTLNLPVTSSLSISMEPFGSEVLLCVTGEPDTLILNDQPIPADTPFARRVTEFLDLFRPGPTGGFHVAARNTIPTAAGFASSASGFAALVLALDRLFGWALDGRALSILARLGSGSACRSVYTGFVEWLAGSAPDGMDSYAVPLEAEWPDLRMGLVFISSEEKAIGSRAAMARTVSTSPLYAAWPAKVTADLVELKAAIRDRDFHRLGRTAQSNALTMHATMIAAQPSILYWQPGSVAAMHRVMDLQEQGLPVYFTMDAGPNLKLLFEQKDQAAVEAAFPGLVVVSPFEQS